MQKVLAILYLFETSLYQKVARFFRHFQKEARFFGLFFMSSETFTSPHMFQEKNKLCKGNYLINDANYLPAMIIKLWMIHSTIIQVPIDMTKFLF